MVKMMSELEKSISLDDSELIYNMEFNNWLELKKSKGYQENISVWELQELIDKLVSWYEFKYSDSYINQKYCYQNGHDKLAEAMTFPRLLERLTLKQAGFLKGFYHQEDGMDYVWIENQKNSENLFVKFNRDSRIAIIPDEFEVLINNNIKKIYLEYLFDLLKKDGNYDLSCLERIISNWDTDLEYRLIILNLVYNRLASFSYSDPDVALKRAELFAQDILNNLGVNVTSGLEKSFVPKREKDKHIYSD